MEKWRLITSKPGGIYLPKLVTEKLPNCTNQMKAIPKARVPYKYSVGNRLFFCGKCDKIYEIGLKLLEQNVLKVEQKMPYKGQKALKASERPKRL